MKKEEDFPKSLVTLCVYEMEAWNAKYFEYSPSVLTFEGDLSLDMSNLINLEWFWRDYNKLKCTISAAIEVEL